MAKKRKTKRKILPIPFRDTGGGEFKIPKEKPRYLNEKPKFAFNHYVDSDKNYSFKCITDCRQFHTFFRNLKHMCSLTWGKIKQAHQFHAHEINWNIDTLPEVVKQLEKKPGIKDLSLFQFKAFDESRIVGLFNYDCVFEIIYIAREHEIFPSKN